MRSRFNCRYPVICSEVDSFMGVTFSIACQVVTVILLPFPLQYCHFNRIPFHFDDGEILSDIAMEQRSRFLLVQHLFSF